jgi:hypothetical protein
LDPTFKILETVTVENCDERECYWIEHYGGVKNLLNVVPGGRRIYDYETIAAKLRGRKRPDTTVRLKKLWSEQGGKWRNTEGVSEKLRKANKEQFADPEKRAKHKKGMEEWSANLTEEDRQKLREGQAKAIATGGVSRRLKKFWASMSPEEREEFCRKRSEAQDHTPTLGFIEACSEGQKQAWTNEAIRNARISGIKAAWADPIKRAARIEKNKLKRAAKA